MNKYVIEFMNRGTKAIVTQHGKGLTKSDQRVSFLDILNSLEFVSISFYLYKSPLGGDLTPEMVKRYSHA